MRDPARIDVALEHLRSAWLAHPDWRLGQLVYNATRDARSNAEIFFIEDAPLVQGLDKTWQNDSEKVDHEDWNHGHD